jgi:hypothetical protein
MPGWPNDPTRHKRAPGPRALVPSPRGFIGQRPLSRLERELLETFLAHDFAGVEPLREQARNVLASRGCKCGCGTLDLHPQGLQAVRSTARSPVEVEGRVLDADAEDIGGLLLFLGEGLLSSLEVYSHFDPLPLPELSQVTGRRCHAGRQDRQSNMQIARRQERTDRGERSPAVPDVPSTVSAAGCGVTVSPGGERAMVAGSPSASGLRAFPRRSARRRTSC